MSTSKPELLTENVALREEIDQLRAALVLWRDLYEVVNAGPFNRTEPATKQLHKAHHARWSQTTSPPSSRPAVPGSNIWR